MKQNQTYNIEIDKGQLIELIQRLDFNGQVDLINTLKESTFLKRFEKLLASLKTNDLSIDEITKEVEAVRQRRYDDGKHNFKSNY